MLMPCVSLTKGASSKEHLFPVLTTALTHNAHLQCSYWSRKYRKAGEVRYALVYRYKAPKRVSASTLLAKNNSLCMPACVLIELQANAYLNINQEGELVY